MKKPTRADLEVQAARVSVLEETVFLLMTRATESRIKQPSVDGSGMAWSIDVIGMTRAHGGIVIRENELRMSPVYLDEWTAACAAQHPAGTASGIILRYLADKARKQREYLLSMKASL